MHYQFYISKLVSSYIKVCFKYFRTLFENNEVPFHSIRSMVRKIQQGTQLDFYDQNTVCTLNLAAIVFSVIPWSEGTLWSVHTALEHWTSRTLIPWKHQCWTQIIQRICPLKVILSKRLWGKIANPPYMHLFLWKFFSIYFCLRCYFNVDILLDN